MKIAYCAFSPPYGDGILFHYVNPTQITFSPLCGDCTCGVEKDMFDNLFSPPYGDGTEFEPTNRLAKKFSPPYGDCTVTTSLSAGKT